MQVIKNVEKSILRFLQSREFLNIIDQKHIDTLVKVDEVIDRIERRASVYCTLNRWAER